MLWYHKHKHPAQKHPIIMVYLCCSAAYPHQPSTSVAILKAVNDRARQPKHLPASTNFTVFGTVNRSCCIQCRRRNNCTLETCQTKQKPPVLACELQQSCNTPHVTYVSTEAKPLPLIAASAGCCLQLPRIRQQPAVMGMQACGNHTEA